MKTLKLSTLTASLLLLISTLAGHGANATCLNAKEVAPIKAALEMPGIDTSEQAFCDPTSQAYKIFDALITIKQTRFPKDRPASSVDQNFFGSDFWSYYSDRIKTMENETPDGCEGRMAFTLAGIHLHTVFVCPTFYLDHTSKLERIAVLLHEPRHDEETGYGHVQCTQPYMLLAGDACDDSFADKGAWAVTIEALHLLLDYANLNQTDINLAKYKMLEIGSVYFNQPLFSLDKNSAFYLYGKDATTAFIFSDDGLKTAPIITNGKPISRRFSISVFPTDKSDSYTAGLFTDALQVLPPLGASSVAYNEEDKGVRQPVVDILNDDDEMIAVTSHTLDILGVPKMTLEFDISGIISSTEAGEKPSQNFYLADASGSYHKVLKGRGGDVSVVASTNPIGDFKEVIVFEGKRLGLRNDGSVMISTPQGWIEFAPLAHKTFSFISRPFLWSESLNTNKTN